MQRTRGLMGEATEDCQSSDTSAALYSSPVKCMVVVFFLDSQQYYVQTGM